MSSRTRIGVAVLVMVMTVLPLACQSGGNKGCSLTARGPEAVTQGGGENAASARTYALTTVDGHAIPFAPLHQGQQIPEIVSGSLTLKDDGTFVSAMSYGKPDGGSFDRDFRGAYSLEGSDLILKWEGAGETKVTVEGNVLTMDNAGMLFVYEK